MARQPPAICLLLFGAVALFLGLASPVWAIEGKVHVVFSAECNNYFDWQSLALVRSFHESGMSELGPITRLLACNDEDLKTYNKTDLVPTHVHPSFNLDPETGDYYPPYNKPGSVWHWLTHADPPVDATWVVILDADMIIRRPFDLQKLGVGKGTAVSAFYGYLVGVTNGMVDAFLPPENAKYAAQVGGFMLYHIDDLRKVAPMWLNYTKFVRSPACKDWWNRTGDVFVTPENPVPWISEMYGYVFATAMAKVTHVVNNELMVYPNYPLETGNEPAIIHYGLKMDINKWDWDKHYFLKDDMCTCPVQVFKPLPPKAEEIWDTGVAERRGKMLTLECIDTINAALRELAVKTCKNHDYDEFDFTHEVGGTNFVLKALLKRETKKDVLRGGEKKSTADTTTTTLLNAFDHATPACKDINDGCKGWAKSGECERNPGFMRKNCRRSCRQCSPAENEQIAKELGLSTETTVSKASDKGDRREAVEDSKGTSGDETADDGKEPAEEPKEEGKTTTVLHDHVYGVTNNARSRASQALADLTGGKTKERVIGLLRRGKESILKRASALRELQLHSAKEHVALNAFAGAFQRYIVLVWGSIAVFCSAVLALALYNRRSSGGGGGGARRYVGGLGPNFSRHSKYPRAGGLMAPAPSYAASTPAAGTSNQQVVAAAPVASQQNGRGRRD